MEQNNYLAGLNAAAEMLMRHALVSDLQFEIRPVGITGQFSSLCDGDCGDGNCGQCN